jgi:hypothetical protein
MSDNLVSLLWKARMALGVASQGEFGKLLGSSVRSGQRWERGEAIPTDDQMAQLARLVHPKNAELAAAIAAETGTTLVQLGVVAPPAVAAAPAPPPAPPPPDPVYLVDTVVCAAAEAVQMMPEAIRPALRAGFRRAALAGLSIETINRAFDGPLAKDAAQPPGKGAKGAGKA